MTAHETEQLFLKQLNTAIVQYTTFTVLNVSNTLSPNQLEIVRDGTSGDGGRQKLDTGRCPGTLVVIS